MPRYQIIPSDRPEASVEIDGIDAGAALHVASQLRCGQADVHENGSYLFSVRTLGGEASFWEIFQRAVNEEELVETDLVGNP